jgi:hypothetical protein
MQIKLHTTYKILLEALAMNMENTNFKEPLIANENLWSIYLSQFAEIEIEGFTIEVSIWSCDHFTKFDSHAPCPPDTSGGQSVEVFGVRSGGQKNGFFDGHIGGQRTPPSSKGHITLFVTIHHWSQLKVTPVVCGRRSKEWAWSNSGIRLPARTPVEKRVRAVAIPREAGDTIHWKGAPLPSLLLFPFPPSLP